MDERRSGFWSTLPGVLTGAAAVITAATGAFLAFNRSPDKAQAGIEAAQANPDQKSGGAALASPATPITLSWEATVADPDGWTNVRSAPSAAGAVIGRVEEGELFRTRPQTGEWWKVRTAEGLEGYVHRSRIRLGAEAG